MATDFDKVFAQAGLDVRLSQADDNVFLEQVFRSTREDLLQLNLPPSMLDMLLSQQYRAQQQSYQQQWPGARVWVIRALGVAVGKIMLAESAQAIRIIDIAFMPGERGKGRGRALLKLLQTAAAEHHLVLTLAVDNRNWRARKLYELLEFVVTEATDTHEYMKWPASEPDLKPA
jgi:ribosomal protein S18 acetylase RimI-like enzyme